MSIVIVDEGLQAATMRRIRLRLLSLLIIAFLVTYLDRVNVGFAALTANRDLGLSTQEYGLGASIFFFGYFLFELPSNLALEQFGVRIWLGRILITIGLISSAMALVSGARSFYLAAGQARHHIPWIGRRLIARDRHRHRTHLRPTKLALFESAPPLVKVSGGGPIWSGRAREVRRPPTATRLVPAAQRRGSPAR